MESTTLNKQTFTSGSEETLKGAGNPVSVTRAKISRDVRKTVGEWELEESRVRCREVNVYYGDKPAIRDVTLDIGRNEVIAMIGPSGCGKSTFLRCLNRMNDTIDGCRVTGRITLDDMDIYGEKVDVVPLRAQV